MKILEVPNGHLLRFVHGEEIVAGLGAFAERRGITAAWVNGLGALESAEIGYYDLAAKEYLRRQVEEEVEVTALVGNLARAGEEVVAHLHVTLGRRDFTTLGGHLFRGVAGATVELAVMGFEGVRLERALDAHVGLKLWHLPQEETPAS